MQYDTKKQVATQLCITKCPCSQYCTQYGCNMKWTQDHSKVNLHFTLANGSDISLFMCYHIALIPLLKTVQKDVCLESGRNALPTIYTRVKTRLCTWSNTTTQTPLDSVGMQPHREQPQATNLMDLLCDQLGTTK